MNAIDLQAKIKDLETGLDVEQVHNDHLTTLNIDLKNQIRALEQKLKVVVLPVTVQNLVAEIEAQDERMEVISDAFINALGMIEINDDNRLKVEYLKRVYQDIC